MRIIRCKNSLTVTLSGGRILQTNDCTDWLFDKVKDFYKESNEFEIINLLIPEEEEDTTVEVPMKDLKSIIKALEDFKFQLDE